MKIRKSSLKLKLFLTKWENRKNKAYLCPANKWTIGIGHTGSDVFEGLVISEQRIDELYEQDITKFEALLNSFLDLKNIDYLTQDEYDSCIALIYNVGMGNHPKATQGFLKYNLSKHIVRYDAKETLEQKKVRTKQIIKSWTSIIYATINGKKEVVIGLKNRRYDEAIYFLTGQYPIIQTSKKNDNNDKWFKFVDSF